MRAVYRALSKKFHPDTGNYPKREAEEHFRLLNEVYSIIGDPQRRKGYDNERSKRTKQRLQLQAESVSSLSDGFSNEENRAWKIVEEYHPDVIEEFKSIANLSPALGKAFRVMLQKTKAYSDYKELSGILVASYLQAYFGENPQIREFGKWCLTNGHVGAAIELNRTIAALGTSVPTTPLIRNITKKHRLEPEGYYISGADREAMQAQYSRMTTASIWLISIMSVFIVFILVISISHR